MQDISVLECKSHEPHILCLSNFMTKTNNTRKKRDAPGPKPEVLKITGIKWQDAVKQSLQKKKPPNGWPK